MRANIFLLFAFVAVSVTAQGSLKPIIRPLTPGKIEINIVGQDKRLDDILNNSDTRICERIHVDSVPLADVRRIFEVYGGQATKLTLILDVATYQAQNVFDVINLLPNLEELTLTVKGKIEGEILNILTLKNLKKIVIKGGNSNASVNFLAKALPRNLIKTLELQGDENYGELLNKQRSIKSLRLFNENTTFNSALNHLQLDSLECNSITKNPSSIPIRRQFIKDVIKSQPDLKLLKFSSGQGDNIFNDELLREISKLSKLESLVLWLENLSTLEPLRNLRNLKELFLFSGGQRTIQLFNQFSNMRFDFLKKLAIKCEHFGNGFDLPAGTYERMSRNLPNLAYLEVHRSHGHTINFYAKTFPQIREISLKFGTLESSFEFSEAFERNTKIVQRNLRKIFLEFEFDQRLVDADDFVGFLRMFPTLEELSIAAKFPFNAGFFTKLADNVNNLKVLKLESILVDLPEQFPAQKSNALKELAKKLKNLKLKLFVKLSGPRRAFNFQPLIDQVKDVFRSRTAPHDTRPELFLEAGGK